MKTKLKTLFTRNILPVMLLFIIVSCENEDNDPQFTIPVTTDEIAFTNSFLGTYYISLDTSTNIAERVVWNAPDFGAITEIKYTVDISPSQAFEASADEGAFSSGKILETHFAITVDALLKTAAKMNLDSDPNTSDKGNTGILYVRVTAEAGDATNSNGVAKVSETVAMPIEIVEEKGACTAPVTSNWGMVGSAVNDWGNNNQGYAATNDVEMLQLGEDQYGGIITFVDGEFKFRKEGKWDENFGDTGADGTLEAGGDNIAATAGTYIVTMDTSKNTYTVTAASVVWGLVGSATLNGWNGPDLKMYPDPCNEGVFIAKGVSLTDGEIKFRKDDKWDENLGDSGADGTTDPGGDNIVVTAGTYDIMLDTAKNTYSITN